MKDSLKQFISQLSGHLITPLNEINDWSKIVITPYHIMLAIFAINANPDKHKYRIIIGPEGVFLQSVPLHEKKMKFYEYSKNGWTEFDTLKKVLGDIAEIPQPPKETEQEQPPDNLCDSCSREHCSRRESKGTINCSSFKTKEQPKEINNISKLRGQFEYEYTSKKFYLERNGVTGEYRNSSTFQAWGAYKLCAKLNGILPEGFDIYSDESK